MITLAITGNLKPQMIQSPKELIKNFNPNLKIETLPNLSIPTDETLNDLNSAVSLPKQYANAKELVDEIKAEIKAENENIRHKKHF